MKMKTMLMMALAMALPFAGFSKAKLATLTYGDGEELEPEDTVSFMVEDLPDEIGGYEVLSEYLPDGIMVEWTGKKFKAPKSGSVKYSKKEEDFVTTSDENPCGFKVSVNKKTARVTGSFKVYVKKSEKKLKTYSAKFAGYLGGQIVVTIKKVGTFAAALD